MARPIILAVDDDASVLEAVVQDLRRKYGAEIPHPARRIGAGRAGYVRAAERAWGRRWR